MISSCLALVAAAHAAAGQGPVDYPFTLKFEHVAVSGMLQVDKVKTQSELEDLRSFERLWHVSAGKQRTRFPITSLQDLKGKVSVETEEAALEFVRLRTSIDTFNFFLKGNWALFEIFTAPRFEKRHSYGFWRGPSHDWPAPEGKRGVIKQKTWESFGLQEATVRRNALGFFVTREVVLKRRVLVSDSFHYSVFTIHELVTADGGYEVVRKIPKPKVKIDWSLLSRDNERVFGHY